MYHSGLCLVLLRKACLTWAQAVRWLGSRITVSIRGWSGSDQALEGPDPRMEEILSLQPDLVIANQEENPRELVEMLDKSGLTIWLVPRSIQDTLNILWTMTDLFQLEEAVLRLRILEDAIRLAERFPV